MVAFGTLYAIPSRNGVYKAPSFHGKGCRIVNMGEMFGHDFISDQEMSRVALTTAELAANALHDGDLLFGRRSVVESGAGKCSLVLSPTSPLSFESSIIRVRLKEDRALAPFFYYFFKSPEGRQRIRNIVSGTNVKGIRGSELHDVLVPVPSLAEQRAVAAVLSDVDAQLNSLDRLIAKKRDLNQAAMQQLLVGGARLSGFSRKWETKRLGDIAHIKTGSRNNEDKVKDGAYPLFVRSATVERIDSYSYDCEAILVPGEGGIGSIFHYVNGKFDCHQRVYKISAFDDATCGKFVFYAMKHGFRTQATRNSVKATVDSLRLPTFLEFEFLAPSRPEQEAIAAVLSDMDAEIAALERRREKFRLLKQGMMQELLTGRTRLV